MRVKKITEYEIFTGEKFYSAENCRSHLYEVISDAERRMAEAIASRAWYSTQRGSPSFVANRLRDYRSDILTIGLCLKDLQELDLYEKQTEEFKK